MKIQKSILSILTIVLSLILFSACSTSNEVVSNNFITKRKYNKGFHIDYKKRYNVEKESDLSKKEIKDIEVSEEITLNNETQLFSANTQDNLIQDDSHTNSSNFDNSSAVLTNTDLDNTIKINSKTVQSETSIEEKSIVSKIAKQSLKIKRNYSESNSTSFASETETLLLVILCFFLSPLAVYLHQGSWNTKCWINLILYLLFILPGLIHGLYVILVD